jgi:anhydro-N-acetylmuramic acid kinase
MDLALGLISGTSMDGIDVALIGSDSAPLALPTLAGFRTQPYDADLSAELRLSQQHGNVAHLARLNVAVGEAFAEAALGLLDELSVRADEVRCIGSHGQTLVHLPVAVHLGGHVVRTSLQIGDPAVIAARTGIITVADFRSMDMALGGEGAPLVPLLDWRLYSHATRGRVLLNLGGVANVTGLPPGAPLESVIAFDTGPGNVLLDAVARDRDLLGGIDRGGELALSGRVVPQLLEVLLADDYYARVPPKSADAGQFVLRLDGESVASLATADVLATATELTVMSVVDAVERWIAPHQQVDEVLVAGGGVHNRALMDGLRARLPSVEPVPPEAGIPPDAKEAAAFAMLALETLAGRPGNVPSATGAAKSAVLGSVVRPPR